MCESMVGGRVRGSDVALKLTDPSHAHTHTRTHTRARARTLNVKDALYLHIVRTLIAL